MAKKKKMHKYNLIFYQSSAGKQSKWARFLLFDRSKAKSQYSFLCYELVKDLRLRDESNPTRYVVLCQKTTSNYNHNCMKLKIFLILLYDEFLRKSQQIYFGKISVEKWNFKVKRQDASNYISYLDYTTKDNKEL